MTSGYAFLSAYSTGMSWRFDGPVTYSGSPITA